MDTNIVGTLNYKEYYYLSDTNLCPVTDTQQITISELVRKDMDVDELNILDIN